MLVYKHIHICIYTYNIKHNTGMINYLRCFSLRILMVVRLAVFFSVDKIQSQRHLKIPSGPERKKTEIFLIYTRHVHCDSLKEYVISFREHRLCLSCKLYSKEKKRLFRNQILAFLDRFFLRLLLKNVFKYVKKCIYINTVSFFGYFV